MLPLFGYDSTAVHLGLAFGVKFTGVWWGWGADAQNAWSSWPPCLRLGPRWGRPLLSGPRGLALEAGWAARPRVPAWAHSPKLRPELGEYFLQLHSGARSHAGVASMGLVSPSLWARWRPQN